MSDAHVLWLRLWICVADVLNAQLTEEFPVTTPVEWQTGGNCCILPDLSEQEIKNKFPKGHESRELPSGKGYLKITPDPRS